RLHLLEHTLGGRTAETRNGRGRQASLCDGSLALAPGAPRAELPSTKPLSTTPNRRASRGRQIRPAARLGEDRVRDGERLKLEALKSNLLRQQHVADGKAALWSKAQEAGAVVTRREFFKRSFVSLMDAEACAGWTAH